MNNLEYLNLITPVALLIAVIAGIYFLIIYSRGKRIQAKMAQELERSSRNERRVNVNLKDQLEKLSSIKQTINQVENYVGNKSSGLYFDGYIIIDLPDNLHSMFHDLLKGFEDFAKLKGYNVTFSIDNSLERKIAFKFTLQNEGIIVSTQTVRQDIKEYIDKVKNGDNFDDLPIIISPAEHSLISTTLKDRLNFLHQNYALEKNTRYHYENLLKTIVESNSGIRQPASIYIQTGGSNNPKSLVTNNSPNSLLGDNNHYENNTDNSDHSVITITNSFNKKKDQIERLDEIIRLLSEEKNIEASQRQTLVTNFDKIKEELADEEQPSKPKIFKWLSNTKKILENVVLSHHTTEAIHWIYENFNFIIHKIGN